MTPIRRSGPQQARPDTHTLTATEDVTATVPQASDAWWDPNYWTDVVEWWHSPADAYVAGLADGARLERDRIAAEDHQLHHAAAKAVLGLVLRGERRDAAQRGVADCRRCGAEDARLYPDGWRCVECAPPGPRPGDWAGVAA